MVDVGKEFVKTTYGLEGDGPLVLYCFENIQAVFESIRVQYNPNVDAVILQLSNSDANIADQWKAFALDCMKPTINFFVI